MAIFPNSHYVSAPETRARAIAGRPRGAARAAPGAARRRTSCSRRSGSSSGPCSTWRCWSRWGFCPGIENYSRWLSGPEGRATRRPASSTTSRKDFLLVIDESHQTIPQIGAMYRGDRSRKETLVEYGFRLPSALDNRPLKFEEFERMVRPGHLRLGHPGRVRAAEGARAWWSSRSSAPPAWSTPRSRSGRSARRWTTSWARCASAPRPGSGCSSPPSPSAWPRT